MLQAGVPVGAGTDATRVATYNPFVSLFWLVTGQTVGGLRMASDENRMSRMEALELWTKGSAWFSSEQGRKGALVPGMLADLAVLSADYFSIEQEQIKSLESVLTIVAGQPVYAQAEFSHLDPPPPPVLPDWSPVRHYGGYHNRAAGASQVQHRCTQVHAHAHAHHAGPSGPKEALWGACSCWAF
jgi:hypothetical protein